MATMDNNYNREGSTKTHPKSAVVGVLATCFIVMVACSTNPSTAACLPEVTTVTRDIEVPFPQPMTSVTPLATFRLSQNLRAVSAAAACSPSTSEVGLTIVDRTGRASTFDYTVEVTSSGKKWIATGNIPRLEANQTIDLGVISRDTTPVGTGAITISIQNLAFFSTPR